MTTDLKVLIRNSSYQLVGELDDYTRLTLVPRFNAVGSWAIELNAASSKAALLNPRAGSANPGGGIVVQRNGITLLSGPIRHFGWTRSGEGNREGVLSISGPDDMTELAQRLVFPNPANNVNLQGSTAFYSISGASTKIETLMRNVVNLNAGPGALVQRRVSGLTLATDLLRGTATAYRGKFRFERLVDALAEIARAAPTGLASPLARGGLGFRVIQVGTGLQFQVYDTTSRVLTAKFSFELGNLVDAGYDLDAPSTTVAILGAGRTATFTNGPQVASTLSQYTRTDSYFPTVYAETFVDVGEIDPAASDVTQQLDAAAEDAYDSGAGQVGLSIKPVDTDSLRFGEHWYVGDIVTVKTPFLTIQEQVRQVEITYGADDNEKIDATIGTVDGAYRRRNPGVYRVVRNLVRQFEFKKVVF